MFITVEGIDGSGKSTVISTLQEELESVKYDVVTTREPSPHWTGPQVREAINDDETHPMTDFHFFVGDRAYHIKHTIAPALEADNIVISDRYSDSTRAYQQENLRGYVSDPMEFIEYNLGDWHLEPDMTLLIDVPAEVGVKRASDGDKYEVPEFLENVRENYRDIARRDSDRITVIDGTQPEERVADKAVTHVLRELPIE